MFVGSLQVRVNGWKGNRERNFLNVTKLLSRHNQGLFVEMVGTCPEVNLQSHNP